MRYSKPRLAIINGRWGVCALSTPVNYIWFLDAQSWCRNRNRVEGRT